MNKNLTFTERFGVVIARMFGGNSLPDKIAVAVSGGADSMALVFALADYAPATQIYALSVDHRLREEAADEAKFVGDVVRKLPNTSHHVLVWEQGDSQDTRVEEKAREARYGLLYRFMGQNNITHLFVGHHQNDQAETFLFRLAKGSGLDGLACMLKVSDVLHNGSHFVLCRPLLDEKKSDILEYVAEHNISYIEDPSNQDEAFARVRLRKSMEILSEEGLTPKRLSVTAKRIKRARDAIGYITDVEYKNLAKSTDTGTIVLESVKLAKQPFEIVVRIILKAMNELKGESGSYGPRLERVENLCEDLVAAGQFRKRTLHGIIFEYDVKSGEIVLLLEKPNNPKI